MGEGASRFGGKPRQLPLRYPEGIYVRSVFADTGYWIALLNPRDDLHQEAVAQSQRLGTTRFITTESVLTELLNEFAKRGAVLRAAAVRLVNELQTHPRTSVFAQSHRRFQQAVDLYAERPDKNWNLTDCSSFCLMRERKMNAALTHDKHFEQAGFVALLRQSDSS
jgi:predicted nucleic acid-binding protein